MKKSLIVVFAILSLIVLGWFLQNRELHSLFLMADSNLKKISALIYNDEYNKAENTFDRYNKEWKKSEKKLCLVISHEDIDFITRCNGQLRAYLSAYGKEEALGVIAELYATYHELDRKFRVNFKTIL